MSHEKKYVLYIIRVIVSFLNLYTLVLGEVGQLIKPVLGWMRDAVIKYVCKQLNVFHRFQM
jgi:hypothetical protein